MLSMKQKVVLVVLVSALTAVIAAGLIRAKVTYDVELVSSPNGAVVYAPAGQPFNISCQVVGGDAGLVSRIQWLDPNGNPVGQGNPGILKSANNLLYLTFSDPKSEDRGIYKCTVKYGNKYDLRYAVNLVFYGPAPEFEPDFENATYTEGERAQLHCYALGETPMSYEWFDQSLNRIQGNGSISILKSSNESFLVFDNVQPSDGGMYSCNAKNSHGLSSKVFFLFVTPRSGDNDTFLSFDVKVVNVTATSVEFKINVTEPAEYVVVKYMEERSYKEDRRQIALRPDNLITIDNLVPGGNYSFQFFVGTGGGNGSNNTGGFLTFFVTLLPDAPDLIVRRQEKGSLELEWFRPVDDIMRGTIDRYEISYYSLSIQSGNRFIPSDCAITIQVPTCRGSSYMISGLQPRVYYQVEVRAHTAAGYGEPTKQKVYLPG